jgi:hypothetical protein
MAAKVRAVEYFNATVRDLPGAAYEVLRELAAKGVNLLAFSAVPVGPEYTHLSLFPANRDQLLEFAADSGTVLTGPQCAFLVQGDDELGALTDLHRRLYDAGVNVYASSGVTDGDGGFGYLLYVRKEEFTEAQRALGVQGC